MANIRKKISELTALTSASLDTTLVGVDGGTTYKIELDTLADAVTSRVNILDRDRLQSLESVTSSFETKGRSIISSSAQISAFGFISSSHTDITLLNSFTASQSILNTAFTNGISARLQTSSFELFSSSVHSEILAATNEQSFNGLISGSSQLTGSYDERYVLSGSITQTTWDNIANKPIDIISSSTQITDLGFISSSHTDITSLNSFTSSQQILNTAFTNGISARLQTSSFNDFSASVHSEIVAATNEQSFNGLISGSSQLTSSYDVRYVLSGSITQTTWDNIANKPDGIVSQSVDIADFSFTSQTITNGAITLHATDADIVLNADGDVYLGSANSGNGIVTDGYLENIIGDTSMINTGTGHSITDNLNNIINNRGIVSSSTQIADLGFVTGSYAYLTEFNSLTQSFNIISGSVVNITNAVDVTQLNNTTASLNLFTQSANTRLNNIELKTGSFVTTSSFNSYTASISTASLVTSISNLNSATSSYLTSLSGAISSSSQLTSSYDSRYVLSGSITQTTWDNIASKPAGIVSGSSQVLGGSGVVSGSYETTGRGIISSSANLVTTSSFNTYTSSISTASLVTSITNLNSFSASENTKASTLASYTASVNITTSSLNAFTSSINSWTSSFSSSLTSSITSVSGAFSNLTINGQPTTYGYVNGSYLFASNNTDQGSVGNGTAIAFQTTNTSNGSLISKGSNTQVTLTAGNAYKLEAIIRRFTSNSSWGTFRWYDVTNSTYVGVEAFGEMVTSGAGVASTGIATHYVTPSVNTTYELRQTTNNTITVNGGYASYEITQLNPSIAIQATATGTTTTNLIKYTRTTQQSGLSNGSVVVCNVLENTSGNAISANTSTGQITLTAGKTYRLIGMIPNFTTSGGDVRPQFCWYNETTAAYIGNSAAGYVPSSGAGYGSFGGHAEAVITANATTIVSFRLQGGASGLAALGGNGDFATAGSYPWIDVQEIGSTFALNALDTMQISGSLAVTGSTTLKGAVTIGTGSANEGGEIDFAYAQNTTLTGSILALDVYQDRLRIFEGGGNARGVYIDLSKAPAGVAGELIWKTSGFVNAGTFVTLDNLKCTVTTSGNRGLSLAAVSTSFVANIDSRYSVVGGAGGGQANNITYTTTASTSLFAYHFPTEGDGSVYNILDKTNSRFYRVTLMIGSGYNNNFISIERLY
jgi:hypothetical protein